MGRPPLPHTAAPEGLLGPRVPAGLSLGPQRRGFEVTFQPLAAALWGARSRAWLTWQVVSPATSIRRPWQWQQGHIGLLAITARVVVAGERGGGKLAASCVLFPLVLMPLSLNERAGLHLEAPRGVPMAAGGCLRGLRHAGGTGFEVKR